LASLLAKEPAARPATPAALAVALGPFTKGSDLPALLAKARLRIVLATDEPQAEVDTADQRLASPPDTHTGGRVKAGPWTTAAKGARRVALGLAALVVVLAAGVLVAARLLPGEGAVPPDSRPEARETAGLSDPPAEARREEDKAGAVYPLAMLTFEERGGG